MGLVRQRGDRDCGVAALASLAGITYEDAYVAVAAIDPVTRGKGGLHNYQVVAVAERLGLTLEPTRAFDLDEDDGILRLRWNGRKGKRNVGGHFIAVRDGFALCPSDGVPLPWREYLEQNDGRAGTLLKEVHR